MCNMEEFWEQKAIVGRKMEARGDECSKRGNKRNFDVHVRGADRETSQVHSDKQS